MSLLLIDADSIIYRAAFATEKTKYLLTRLDKMKGTFDNAKDAKEVAGREDYTVVWSRKELEPVENAINLARLIVQDIVDRYSDLTYSLSLSPSLTFRDAIATRAKYKGNRDGSAKPTHFKAIREFLIEEYGAVIANNEEADDLVAITAVANAGSVICSIDKDLLQVPGKHYNWVNKEETDVSSKQGWLNFCTQVLTGDTSDNVPGVDGIGPKKAAVILGASKTKKQAWDQVTRAYVDKYGDKLGIQYRNEAAALLWIRREPGKGFAFGD